MSPLYQYDYIAFFLTMFFAVVGGIQIIKNRFKVSTYRASLILLFGGIGLVLITTIANIYITGQEVSSHVVFFLLLYKVNKIDSWFVLRYLLAWGYVFMSWGMVTLISTILGRIKQKTY